MVKLYLQYRKAGKSYQEIAGLFEEEMKQLQQTYVDVFASLRRQFKEREGVYRMSTIFNVREFPELTEEKITPESERFADLKTSYFVTRSQVSGGKEEKATGMGNMKSPQEARTVVQKELAGRAKEIRAAMQAAMKKAKDQKRVDSLMEEWRRAKEDEENGTAKPTSMGSATDFGAKNLRVTVEAVKGEAKSKQLVVHLPRTLDGRKVAVSLLRAGLTDDLSQVLKTTLNPGEAVQRFVLQVPSQDVEEFRGKLHVAFGEPDREAAESAGGGGAD
jgi:hypothetical protein